MAGSHRSSVDDDGGMYMHVGGLINEQSFTCGG